MSTTFRIVRVISNSGSKDRVEKFVIEKEKYWVGWKRIYHEEEFVRRKAIEFKTYDEAEIYLLDEYTGNGECKQHGNVYEYSQYNYYY